eukprot:1160494-Pelagomonas_calceolata.AAC.7
MLRGFQQQCEAAQGAYPVTLALMDLAASFLERGYTKVRVMLLRQQVHSFSHKAAGVHKGVLACIVSYCTVLYCEALLACLSYVLWACMCVMGAQLWKANLLMDGVVWLTTCREEPLRRVSVLTGEAGYTIPPSYPRQLQDGGNHCPQAACSPGLKAC